MRLKNYETVGKTSHSLFQSCLTASNEWMNESHICNTHKFAYKQQQQHKRFANAMQRSATAAAVNVHMQIVLLKLKILLLIQI